MNTLTTEVVNLSINNAVGQTKLGYTVFQHAANLV